MDEGRGGRGGEMGEGRVEGVERWVKGGVEGVERWVKGGVEGVERWVKGGVEGVGIDAHRCVIGACLVMLTSSSLLSSQNMAVPSLLIS